MSDSSLINLFKQIIQVGAGFKDYNIRNYIIRRANEDIQKYESMDQKSSNFTNFYLENKDYLELLKRQQVIQNMYTTYKHPLDDEDPTNPNKAK